MRCHPLRMFLHQSGSCNLQGICVSPLQTTWSSPQKGLCDQFPAGGVPRWISGVQNAPFNFQRITPAPRFDSFLSALQATPIPLMLMMSCNACLLLVSPCHPNSCLAHVCGVVAGPQFWRLVSAGSLACCFLSTCLEGNKKSRDISSHIMTHDTRLAASQAFQETKCLPNVGSGALVLASLQGTRGLATRIVHQTSSNMILGQHSNTGMCTLK